MVDKAKSGVAGSFGDSRRSTNQPVRNARTVWGNDGQSMGRWISALLACLLFSASLVALYEVATIPGASSSASDSPRSIQTVRNFYAVLNDYIETGDASAAARILAPHALAFVPDQGAIGEDSGLLTYLLALRSTYPELRFTVQQIDASRDIVIASVRQSGAPAVSTLGLPGAVGMSQEFFRVRDGRIVQHWTTAPSSVLLHPLTVPALPVEVIRPGHLAIAALTFSPNQHDPHLIFGPALVLILSGHLTLTGNGSSQLLDMATGSTSKPELHESASAGPGQAIRIPEHQLFVWNRDADVVTARIATLVENPPLYLKYLPVDRHPPPPINDLSKLSAMHSTVYESVTVRPLAFDIRSIPVGIWTVEIAWAVLGPGASLPRSAESEWAIAQIVSGTANADIPRKHDPGMASLLTNDGGKPVVALVMRVKPVP